MYLSALIALANLNFSWSLRPIKHDNYRQFLSKLSTCQKNNSMMQQFKLVIKCMGQAMKVLPLFAPQSQLLFHSLLKLALVYRSVISPQFQWKMLHRLSDHWNIIKLIQLILYSLTIVQAIYFLIVILKNRCSVYLPRPILNRFLLRIT